MHISIREFSLIALPSATENVELTQKCSIEHLRMGTAILKCGKETEEIGKQKWVQIQRSTEGTKKRSPDGLTVARATIPARLILPEPVYELPGGLLIQTYAFNYFVSGFLDKLPANTLNRFIEWNSIRAYVWKWKNFEWLRWWFVHSAGCTVIMKYSF